MTVKKFIETDEVSFPQIKSILTQPIDEETMTDEQYISYHIAKVESESKPTFGQFCADKIASFGGSWTFILMFGAILSIWIFLNALIFKNPFDPFPFILLNLILSCLAALQAPVIMMSQNRQEEKDRRRSRSDYMVNLKAEIEIREIGRNVNKLISNHMAQLFEIQRKQIEHLEKLVAEIDRKTK